ncbi:MAG: helix-turn-helix domain-containing protein [Clostridium sp.]
MAIIRVNKTKKNPYVTLNKTVLEDENLSFKAKGIHAYLMSKPDNWICKKEDLINNSKDGDNSIRSGLRELREAGYIKKVPIKDNFGKIIEWEEELYETPTIEAKNIFQKQEEQRIERAKKMKAKKEIKEPQEGNLLKAKSTRGFSTSGKTTSGKPSYIINTNILNTEILNNEFSISTTSDLKSIFEGNICLLKLTTEIQFNEYLAKYDYNFVKAVIIYCIRCNAKSFAYFKTTIDKYIELGITTAPEFLNQVEQFIKEKYGKPKKDKNNFVEKNKKVDTFNNFEQRKYDFDELEKELVEFSVEDMEGDAYEQPRTSD